ncbi:hypothetical protein B296_00002634 [Ensete ventricosum]|uniref:Uncharacterized protein n=1 Tax=Ensete ventricosum TaxID=4639 RepID=A0A427B9I1_ENSVE|nr:hypothetical protein B296_00002634 [Ensete ventricosum]
METILDQTLQEGKLVRQVNALIAAMAVASATMTPLATDAPANRLLELVAKVSKMKQAVLADSRDGPVRPVIRTFYDHSQLYRSVWAVYTGPTGYRYADRPLPGGTVKSEVSLREATLREMNEVRRCLVPMRDEAMPRSYAGRGDASFLCGTRRCLLPRAERTRRGDASSHVASFLRGEGEMRCRLVLSLRQVPIKSNMAGNYHVTNGNLLNSTGTDHPIPHLYDINTFKCYLTAGAHDLSAKAAINQAWVFLA